MVAERETRPFGSEHDHLEAPLFYSYDPVSTDQHRSAGRVLWWAGGGWGL